MRFVTVAWNQVKPTTIEKCASHKENDLVQRNVIFMNSTLLDINDRRAKQKKISDFFKRNWSVGVLVRQIYYARGIKSVPSRAQQHRVFVCSDGVTFGQCASMCAPHPSPSPLQTSTIRQSQLLSLYLSLSRSTALSLSSTCEHARSHANTQSTHTAGLE